MRKEAAGDLFFLIGLAGFFLLFHLGKGSLASWDEAIYAVVARDVVERGSWLRLTLMGNPYADKPPLALWMTAVFYYLFGISEWTARLSSALCGVGVVLATYGLGRVIFNRWTGLLGALVLVSSSHFIRFSRFGMTDAPFTLFVTLAFTFFWLGRKEDRYLILSGVMIGLAIMIKSFFAMLVFPVIWIFLVWAGELAILRRKAYWLGLAATTAVALPWFAYSAVKDWHLFSHELLLRGVFNRTVSVLDGHAGNAYFYIRTIINKYHPWVVVGIVSVPFFLWKAIRTRRPEFIFLSVWIFFILAVITAMRTKLAWYVMPLYPAISLSVAYILQKALRERWQRWVCLVFVGIMGLHVHYSHIFDQNYSPQFKALAAVVKKTVMKDKTIFIYARHEIPAATFYFNHEKFDYLDDRQAFLSTAKRNPEFYCLIPTQELDNLRPLPQGTSWTSLGRGEGSEFLLVRSMV